MFGWKAVQQGPLGTFFSIITVLACSRSEAQAEVRRQLSKNASRRQALIVWENQGAMVMTVEQYDALTK